MPGGELCRRRRETTEDPAIACNGGLPLTEEVLQCPLNSAYPPLEVPSNIPLLVGQLFTHDPITIRSAGA
jgi:hypothetical protein